VYGALGRGVVHQLGLEDEIFARLHTFGKALASHGGLSFLEIRWYMSNNSV
jgi:8-amino-7-oxononanoate synthase